MKEILYIQAGEISNFTGTHFWNTQESYLQSDAESEIAADISFCESIDAQGRTTLKPRVLVFDRKSNFGTLGKTNAFGTLEGESTELLSSLWGGHSVEHRQNLIAKSSYHSKLEEEEHNDGAESSHTENGNIGEIRYWSDFNRLYYLPKSLQALPDIPDWDTMSLNWNQGQELFMRFNEETELMEGDLRLLVEECDHMQGIQLMNDTDTFGSFIGTFLASFRDEYQKLSSFAFPVLSGATSDFNTNETIRAKRIVNEALYLRTLNEFSSVNIPLQHPALWPDSVWMSPLKFPSSSTYHQTAILSAHVESSTLPFRLKRDRRDIAYVSAQLKWRGTSPFAELHGIFPFIDSSDFDRRLFNFSSELPVKVGDHVSQLDVTRGFSLRQIEAHSEWLSRYQRSNYFYSANIHASPFPLADTFPPLRELDGDNSIRAQEPGKKESSNPPAVPSYSSLCASTNTAKSLKKYASLIEDYVRRRGAVTASIDIPLDDLAELVNDLWSMYDNSSADADQVSLA